MSGRAISTRFTRLLPRIPCARPYSGGNISISDFAATKKGTGSGSFIELPEFKPLQDSILVKIPSSCTVYGKLNKINAISSDPQAKTGPFLAQESTGPSGFSRIMTGEHPANLMMASPTPMSNITVVKIDTDDKGGLYVPDFAENVLCYSGDLTLDEKSRVKGYGVLALAGKGPVYQVILKEGEEMMVTSESILAYDSQVALKLMKLNSSYGIPKGVSELLSKYFARYYDQACITWNKWFTGSKIYSNIQGPGTFFLQTHFIPGSRNYTEKDIIEALEPRN